MASHNRNINFSRINSQNFCLEECRETILGDQDLNREK